MRERGEGQVTTMRTNASCWPWIAIACLVGMQIGCDEDEPPGDDDTDVQWECVIEAGEEPDFTLSIGCDDDFLVLASRPPDESIPGARSAKTVIDLADENALYYTNSNFYPIHYNFASEHLSGDGLPPVGDISLFNQIEYYSPSRRFLLGAITHYEEPGVWVYEIAPYDTSSADMITQAYDQLVTTSFFGQELYFHPTSCNVETVAEDLPPHVKVITTDELFEGITYQPLNLGESMGQLRFYTTEELTSDNVYVSPRDVV